MVEIREYVAEDGNNRYKDWFNNLDYQAARKVHIAVTRLKFGNFSNVQGVGRGLYEYKIDYGPGYRIYFGKDGDQIIIVVGGGTKKRQTDDIHHATCCWKEYKQRKKQEDK